ncbi:MAG: delta-60 repeat domain-containing protein [Flavobacteriales bacterium]|nr:delta-60 repeat domain-containing protein [Flavobacteriales bacterium]
MSIVDPTFNPTDAGFGRHDGIRIANAVNSPIVNDAAVMADGSIVVGGNFNLHDGRTRRMVSRVRPNGLMDTTFVPADIGAPVNAVLALPDGKMIVGGGFGSVVSVPQRGIARLNANGTLDTGFNPGLGFQSGTSNGNVSHLLLQPDGRVIVAGGFNRFNGASVPSLVRLNSDGSLDATFNVGTGFNATIEDMALQPDGKVLIAGWFTTVNGTSRPGIARLQATGALDTGFAPTLGGGSQCSALALRADGKVWLSGNFSSVNGVPRQNFVLLTTTGATDPGFVPAAMASNGVNSLAAQADGKLLVGKHMNNPNGEARDYLSRFNADGSIDAQFAGVDFDGSILHVSLMPDQRMIVVGAFEKYGTRGEHVFTRLMPDGTVDPTWGQANAFDLGAENIVTQPDGKHVVVGGFLSYFDRAANRVARLHPNGQVDTTFNAWWGINSLVKDVVLQPDGKVLIGGHFVDPFDATYSCRVMRLNTDGSYDNSFVVPWNQVNPVNRLALQNDGKVLAMSLQSLNRLLPDGSLDPSFTVGIANGGLYDIVYLPDGRILVAGVATVYNGASVAPIFRLNSDGSLDPGFDIGTGPNNNSPIQDLELQPSGDILAVGNNFTSFNGYPRNRVVRLHANGSVDTGFNIGSGINGDATLVKVSPTGRIYVSGSFQTVGGITRPMLARLLPNGIVDASFDLGTGPIAPVLGMVFSPFEDVVMVGKFLSVNGIGRDRIARLKNAPTVAARVLLEGPYNGTTMNDALRTLPSFPLVEPFTAMGYANATYTPGKSIPAGLLTTTGITAIVDWVILEMRPAADPSTIAASRAALLLRNGWIVDLNGMSYVGFAGLAPGPYCIAVRSRNHLPVMSSPSVAVNFGAALVQADFTIPAVVVHDEDARKNMNGVMVLAPGDVTFNGTVQYTGTGNDRDPILTRIGGVVPTNTVSGYWREDVNMDGVVKYTGAGNDRDLILQSVGATVPTNTRTATLP